MRCRMRDVTPRELSSSTRCLLRFAFFVTTSGASSSSLSSCLRFFSAARAAFSIVAMSDREREKC